MAAARSLAFTVGAVPDRELPPIPPLRWLFHVADGLFLPGLSHLNLNQTQQVQFLAIVVAIFLFYLAVRSSVPAILRRCYRPLAYVAVALATLLSVLSLQGILPFPLALGTQHYGNDAITVTSCATDDFVHWRNPYDSFNMPQCLSRHDQDGSKTTPLMAGSFKSLMPYPSRATLDAAFSAVVRQGIKHPPQFESYFSYPAASFLLPALFAPFHLSDLSLVYLLVYVALAVLVIWQAPAGAARWMSVLAVCANAALWPILQSGSTDAPYTLLVLLAWIWRDKRWLSTLAIGLAVASRQQAWLFLLFYAVLVYRTEGKRELWWRLAVVTGIFALTNVPFFIGAPADWLSGVLGPMHDPMFPRGSGIIALSTGGTGALPFGPMWLYDVLEVGGLAATLAYFWRTCREQPWTGLVLAPVALFFAWRSLYSYFLPISVLALFPALVAYAAPAVSRAAGGQVRQPSAKEVAA